MNETDESVMKLYGITRKVKTMFYYKQRAYENFADAMRFAEFDTKRNHKLCDDVIGSLKNKD